LGDLSLDQAALTLLLVCYGLVGIALYWGHKRGLSPEDVGTCLVFGSFLFILITSGVIWIVRALAMAISLTRP
jgi:hypothetical protein